jgi:hypothetical protein
MKYNEAFPSEYLKSDDLSGEGRFFTIKNLTLEEFQDPITNENNSKPILHFEDSDKSLILNKTNWERIARQHGEDSQAWSGKQIHLGLEAVQYKGKTIDCIRVKQ